VHHFAEMVAGYLQKHGNFGMNIELSREDVLLDTGGGLKKAAWFFRDQSESADPFLLHNVDVISAIDLAQMLEFHRGNQALATLAVQDRETSRYLLFDDQDQLCGRRARRDQPAEPATALAFSGIHVISPRFLPTMVEQGVFSIIDSYLRVAAQGERIIAFRADGYYWRDMGKPESIALAERDLENDLFRA
jgi:NDP-sugar pyrophosphorylase family protein